MDFFTRKADPMARLTVGMKSKWSKVCNNQRSPKWNELFTFEDVDPEKYDKLTITIFDWERFRAKRHMGSCEVRGAADIEYAACAHATRASSKGRALVSIDDEVATLCPHCAARVPNP